MTRTVALAVAVLAVGAFAATAEAAPSGDTCSATGSGTNYTLTVVLGQSSPEQYGFAVGARGTTAKAASSGNASATTTTTMTTTPPSLPSGTSTSWGLGQAVVPGQTVSISVATATAVTGAFTVVPYDQVHNAWFDAVTCRLSKVALPTGTFAFGAFAKVGTTWTTTLTVPGAGRITIAQNGGTKQLVRTTRVSTAGAGKARATVRLTAAGRAAVARAAVKVKLSIEFEPKNGKPRTRTVTLTLRK